MVGFITHNRGLNLSIPELNICRRSLCAAAVFMTMPKTTVHYNDFSVAGQNNVRLARQPLVMEPEAVPHPVDQFANNKFRLGVAARHSRHYPAALVFREYIRHASLLIEIEPKRNQRGVPPAQVEQHCQSASQFQFSCLET